jgi:hypothetical protein
MSIPGASQFVERIVQILSLGEFRGDGLYFGVLPIDEIIR